MLEEVVVDFMIFDFDGVVSMKGVIILKLLG